MASVATFLSKPPTPSSSLPRPDLLCSAHSAAVLPLFARRRRGRAPTKLPLASSPRASAAASGTKSPASTKKADERVQQVHNIDEFDAALRSAKNKLVVVEYAASDSPNSKQIYLFMVELSRTCSDVEFLLVMGDESEQTRELCQREGIDRVPHFTFYKSMQLSFSSPFIRAKTTASSMDRDSLITVGYTFTQGPQCFSPTSSTTSLPPSPRCWPMTASTSSRECSCTTVEWLHRDARGGRADGGRQRQADDSGGLAGVRTPAAGGRAPAAKVSFFFFFF